MPRPSVISALSILCATAAAITACSSSETQSQTGSDLTDSGSAASAATAGSGGRGSSSGPTGTGGILDFSTSAGVGGGSTGSGDCEPNLTGVVRDFRAYNGGAGHPDFETFSGHGLKGIVEDQLGTDHKPVYAHDGATAHTTGPAEFNQWYRDTSGVNLPISFTITPTIDSSGLATYNNTAFFPIDDEGFGNEGRVHNFHFTFELHMRFTYRGGEVFRFEGDDDLWVFINDRLAIDLGGLHPAQSDQVDLDAAAGLLGIEPGNEYALDLFQAERHTDASNFSIQSTLAFSNCTPIVY